MYARCMLCAFHFHQSQYILVKEAHKNINVTSTWISQMRGNAFFSSQHNNNYATCHIYSHDFLFSLFGWHTSFFIKIIIFVTYFFFICITSSYKIVFFCIYVLCFYVYKFCQLFCFGFFSGYRIKIVGFACYFLKKLWLLVSFKSSVPKKTVSFRSNWRQKFCK